MTAELRSASGLAPLVGDGLSVPCVDGHDRPYLSLDAAASIILRACNRTLAPTRVAAVGD